MPGREESHFLVCMCLFCVVLVVLFRCQALKWVMVPNSTGIYVGFGGWCDIHCKFLSTFQGVCITQWSVSIIFILHMCQCWAYKVCVYAYWYHFLSGICLHFVYKNFHPLMESVYWFHSSPLHLCLFASVPGDLSILVCTSCSLCVA